MAEVQEENRINILIKITHIEKDMKKEDIQISTDANIDIQDLLLVEHNNIKKCIMGVYPHFINTTQIYTTNPLQIKLRECVLNNAYEVFHLLDDLQKKEMTELKKKQLIKKQEIMGQNMFVFLSKLAIKILGVICVDKYVKQAVEKIFNEYNVDNINTQDIFVKIEEIKSEILDIYISSLSPSNTEEYLPNDDTKTDKEEISSDSPPNSHFAELENSLITQIQNDKIRVCKIVESNTSITSFDLSKYTINITSISIKHHNITCNIILKTFNSQIELTLVCNNNNIIQQYIFHKYTKKVRIDTPRLKITNDIKGLSVDPTPPTAFKYPTVDEEIWDEDHEAAWRGSDTKLGQKSSKIQDDNTQPKKKQKQ